MYYKIVSKRDNKLFSIIHSSLGPEYIPGEWVEPKIKHSQLMCFENLESALAFPYQNGEIWECEIEKFEGTPLFIRKGNVHTDIVQAYLSQAISEFLFNRKINTEFDRAPENTVFCNRIKLLKRTT